MNRHDLYWARLGEPIGKRPVLILSRTELNGVRRRIIVAEVTTRIRGASTEVRVGRREGLAAKSVVNLEALHTVAKDRLDRRIGALSSAGSALVDDALKYLLRLP